LQKKKIKMMLKNLIKVDFEYQPFHLANLSPWPLYSSFFTFQLLLSFLLFFNNFKFSALSIYFSFFFLLYVVYNWFYNIIIESTYQGHHTVKVQNGHRMGMILFIVSEIMFFFSFFWAFFPFIFSPFYMNWFCLTSSWYRYY